MVTALALQILDALIGLLELLIQVTVLHRESIDCLALLIDAEFALLNVQDLLLDVCFKSYVDLSQLFCGDLVLLDLVQKRREVGLVLGVLVFEILDDALHFLNPPFQFWYNRLLQDFQVISEALFFVNSILPFFGFITELILEVLVL